MSAAPPAPSRRTTGRTARWPVLALAFAVGLLGVMQLRTQSRLAAAPTRSPATQAEVIAQLVQANAALREQLAQLREQLQNYREPTGIAEVKALVDDLNRLKIANGLVEISGPGLEVTVSADLRAEEALDLLNELWRASAEGVALNRQRITLGTVVARSEQGLVVQGVRLAPPYRFQAIGDPEAIATALEQKGGLLGLLRVNRPGTLITTRKTERLELPLFEGSFQLRYARQDTN